MIEDLKPAGLEAVEVQAVHRSGREDFPRELWIDSVRRASSDPVASGWRWSGQQQPLHQEWRDRQVALFVDELEGLGNPLHASSRSSRAFHALPAVGQAYDIPRSEEQP